MQTPRLAKLNHIAWLRWANCPHRRDLFSRRHPHERLPGMDYLYNFRITFADKTMQVYDGVEPASYKINEGGVLTVWPEGDLATAVVSYSPNAWRSVEIIGLKGGGLPARRLSSPRTLPALTWFRRG